MTTHDLPPSAGYLTLEHVAIRERLGLLTRSAEEERGHEERAVAAVRAELVAAGLLDDGAGVDAMVEAMHRWLARSPSRMLGYALADLVGDRRAVNQPGTDSEYPNWRLPLAGPDGRPVTLEEVMASAEAHRVTAAARGHLNRGRCPPLHPGNVRLTRLRNPCEPGVSPTRRESCGPRVSRRCGGRRPRGGRDPARAARTAPGRWGCGR